MPDQNGVLYGGNGFLLDVGGEEVEHAFTLQKIGMVVVQDGLNVHIDLTGAWKVQSLIQAQPTGTILRIQCDACIHTERD